VKAIKNLGKAAKNLIVDLKFYKNEPIETSDVCLNGKLFSTSFKLKAQKLLINY
jgi:hypothetical protein